MEEGEGGGKLPERMSCQIGFYLRKVVRIPASKTHMSFAVIEERGRGRE